MERAPEGMTQWTILRGHLRQDDGTLEPGSVFFRRQGTVCLDEDGGTLTVHCVKEAEGVCSLEVRSSRGVWRLVADEDDLLKVGLSPAAKGE